MSVEFVLQFVLQLFYLEQTTNSYKVGQNSIFKKSNNIVQNPQGGARWNWSLSGGITNNAIIYDI